MTGLNNIYLLIITGMIYTIGRWQHRECRRRRAVERAATRDRAKIRGIAEQAASEAASCAAVIDRIPLTQERRLHLTTDQRGI